MEQIRCTRVGAGAGFDHLSYVTVARNWASSSGKLAVYSSFTMHMYSGPAGLRIQQSQHRDVRTAAQRRRCDVVVVRKIFLLGG